eukprot:TRINITY_DN2487_c0_g3_i3.p1 TRINITY_DN2487_c0_g3~~TRINITY_DN2487_c0_g3_i3.p1  ORF type:complete len:869 (-),score=330.63 TRINITY_DN2487_c0_g3_i3:739-3006(-)
MAVLGNYVRKSFSLTTVRSNQSPPGDGEDSEHLDEKPSLCPGCHASTVNVNYFLESNKSIAECAQGSSSRVILSSRRLDELPCSLLSRRHLQNTLTELYLCNNNLTEIPEALAELKLLKYLDLAGNYITTVHCFTRSLFPHLEGLCLDDNLLDGPEVHVLMEAHANFPCLTLIDVRSNTLPSIVCLLKAIEKGGDVLREVYVSGNPFYDEKDHPPHVIAALREDGAAVYELRKARAPSSPSSSSSSSSSSASSSSSSSPAASPAPDSARWWLPALPYNVSAARAPADGTAPPLCGFPRGVASPPLPGPTAVHKLVLRPAPPSAWRRPRFAAKLWLRYCVLEPEEVPAVVAAASDGTLDQYAALERQELRLAHHVGRRAAENALRSICEGEAALLSVEPRPRVCPSAFRPLVGSDRALQHNFVLVILDRFEEDGSVCNELNCMKKKLIKMAPAERKPQTPKENSTCGVHYSIRSMCGLLLFPKKAGCERREGAACPNVLTLALNSARTPEFFRLAVSSMETGEVAQFRVCSKWLSSRLQPGGGSQHEWEKLIAAAPNVLLDLHLIHVLERESPENVAGDSLSEQLLWVRNKLGMGSVAYKKQCYDGAVKQFEEALARLHEVAQVQQAKDTPSLSNDIRSLRQSCHISLAAVAIRRKDFKRAMHYCSLDNCESIPGAGLFRAQARFACVCLKEGELEAAAEVIDKFLGNKHTLTEGDMTILEKLDERRRRLELLKRAPPGAAECSSPRPLPPAAPLQ